MNRKMIFLHIPKSGGRTLHSILERHYPADKTFSIQVTKTRANNTQDFIDMAESDRHQVDLLKGHMSFGMHKLMAGKPSYISFLRSPRERIVSFYYYVLMRKKHRLHRRIADGKMTLHDFVTTIQRGDLHNCQIRFISGIEGDEADMLYQAKENIKRHFSFVGITEHYDESLVLLQHMYDWPTSHYIVENKTKNRPTIDQIEARTLDAIDQRNRGDQQLYDFVAQTFQDQMAACPSFEQKLNKLKRANRLHSNPLVKFVKRKLG